MNATATRISKLRAIADDQPGTPEAAAALRGIERLRVGIARPNIGTCRWWDDAACRLIAYHEETATCFTAGSIARDIRLARPDLRFSVRALTRFVSEQLVNYDGQPAVVLERETTGTSRSPAGVTVQVYAPSVELALGFDFEVEIPRPGQLALGDPAAASR